MAAALVPRGSDIIHTSQPDKTMNSTTAAKASDFCRPPLSRGNSDAPRNPDAWVEGANDATGAAGAGATSAVAAGATFGAAHGAFTTGFVAGVANGRSTAGSVAATESAATRAAVRSLSARIKRAAVTLITNATINE